MSRWVPIRVRHTIPIQMLGVWLSTHILLKDREFIGTLAAISQYLSVPDGVFRSCAFDSWFSTTNTNRTSSE